MDDAIKRSRAGLRAVALSAVPLAAFLLRSERGSGWPASPWWARSS
jgi:hypothetical protein